MTLRSPVSRILLFVGLGFFVIIASLMVQRNNRTKGVPSQTNARVELVGGFVRNTDGAGGGSSGDASDKAIVKTIALPRRLREGLCLV